MGYCRMMLLFAIVLPTLRATIFAEENNSSTYQFHHITKRLVIADGKECKKSGLMCETCKEVSLCVRLSSSQWLKENASSCSTDETCMDTIGNCTAVFNEKCDEGSKLFEFSCQQLGMFPDPFDCSRYHMCTSDGGSIIPNSSSVKYKCPDNYAYDSLTTTCRKKMTNGVCQRPVPRCLSIGQYSVPDNPYMFYICMPTLVGTKKFLFPQFYYCRENYRFVKDSCVDPAVDYQLDANGYCTKKGFLYHSACNYYNDCAGVGSAPSAKSCGINYRFDPNTETCVVLNCY